MKKNILFIFFSTVYLISCSKDKNLEDYKREQIQQTISRISSISGIYTGVVNSKIDGAALGNIQLKFQAKTDIFNTGSQDNTSEERALVVGSISLNGLTSAEIIFDNGHYDDVTSEFQVAIPVAQASGETARLSISGNINNGVFEGTIEVKGQPEFGGVVHLVKNSPIPNTANYEVKGYRMQQILKMDWIYAGSYRIGDTLSPFKMSFINRDIKSENNFYKLFSPVRNVSVVCDFTGFELNFNNAILNDKYGTLVATDPVDQRGVPARATLQCSKFEERDTGKFGWDCEIQTKVMYLNLHLTAKNR